MIFLLLLLLTRFDADIARFEASDRIHPPPQHGTVFVGSSTFTKWHDLERTFRDFSAINRGFGGSTIPEVTQYMDRIVVPYHPDTVVFYAGTNDIADGHSPQQVAQDFEAFATRLHRELPATQLYFISISVAPSRLRWEDACDAANDMIETSIERQPWEHFIDVRPVMVDRAGRLREDLFGPDRLHMNEAGYALWTPIIRDALASSRP